MQDANIRVKFTEFYIFQAVFLPFERGFKRVYIPTQIKFQYTHNNLTIEYFYKNLAIRNIDLTPLY